MEKLNTKNLGEPQADVKQRINLNEEQLKVNQQQLELLQQQEQLLDQKEYLNNLRFLAGLLICLGMFGYFIFYFIKTTFL